MTSDRLGAKDGAGYDLVLAPHKTAASGTLFYDSGAVRSARARARMLGHLETLLGGRPGRARTRRSASSAS